MDVWEVVSSIGQNPGSRLDRYRHRHRLRNGVNARDPDAVVRAKSARPENNCGRELVDHRGILHRGLLARKARVTGKSDHFAATRLTRLSASSTPFIPGCRESSVARVDRSINW